MRIGKPKAGGRENFKMEDGDNVYRILPPLGDLASEGIWNKYYALAWGYKGTDGKQKPFMDASEKNRSNGQIEIMSAALKRRTELEIRQKEIKEAGATPEQMKQINDIMKQFNIEKKYYVCAVNLKGQVGVLKIGYKAYKALVGDKKTNDPGLLKKLNSLDPTFNLTGAFINFHRAGRGLDTQYTVTAYQEDQGDGSFRIKTHTIDEAFYDSKIKPIEKILNLTQLYPEPSLAEIDQIVSGGPEVVDQILGSKQQAEAQEQSAPVEQTIAEAVAPQQQPVQQQEAPAPTLQDLKAQAGVAPSVPETTNSVVPEDPKAAVSVGQSLDPNAGSEGTAPVENTVQASEQLAPKAPAQNAADVDPNEFLKSLGVENV